MIAKKNVPKKSMLQKMLTLRINLHEEKVISSISYSKYDKQLSAKWKDVCYK